MSDFLDLAGQRVRGEITSETFYAGFSDLADSDLVYVTGSVSLLDFLAESTETAKKLGIWSDAPVVSFQFAESLTLGDVLAEADAVTEIVLAPMNDPQLAAIIAAADVLVTAVAEQRANDALLLKQLIDGNFDPDSALAFPGLTESVVEAKDGLNDALEGDDSFDYTKLDEPTAIETVVSTDGVAQLQLDLAAVVAANNAVSATWEVLFKSITAAANGDDVSVGDFASAALAIPKANEAAADAADVAFGNVDLVGVSTDGDPLFV